MFSNQSLSRVSSYRGVFGALEVVIPEGERFTSVTLLRPEVHEEGGDPRTGFGNRDVPPLRSVNHVQGGAKLGVCVCL